MTAVLVALLMAGTDVRVSINPDQPLPFAYVDEPLVLEVTSPAAADAAVKVEFRAENGSAPAPIDLGTLALEEGRPHWSPLRDVAVQRDRYVARFTVSVSGETHQHDRSFCRIDRPVPGYSFPLCAHIDGEAPASLSAALAAISGRAIRLNATAPDIEAVAAAAKEDGLPIVVTFPLERIEDAPALAEGLAQRLGNDVLRWEVEPGGRPEQVAPFAAAIRRSESRAAIGLVAPDADDLERILAAGAGEFVNTLVIAQDAPGPAELEAFRLAAERSGYEGMSLVVFGRGVRSNVMQPVERLNRQVLSNLIAGAESVVDASLILDGRGFGPDYVKLSGMVHRIGGARYIGSLDMGPGLNAAVFRNDGGWILALWADEPNQSVRLRVGNTAGLVLTDARNNALPMPATAEGELPLVVGQEPLYLSGKGGSFLVEAARRRAGQEARAVLEIRDASKELPQDFMGLLKGLEKGDPIDRRGFLVLLGYFPSLEAAHRTNLLSTDVAIPVLAGLGRMVRLLCIVEQERGEPFLEPFQEMLAKCAGYTSKYLAGSGTNGAAYSRQDWLLGEVGRLMGEARQLQVAGHATEADAVAALAECRARALEFVAPKTAELPAKHPARTASATEPSV